MQSPDVSKGLAAIAKRLADLERGIQNLNNKVPAGYFYDANQQVVVAPDPEGGISEPWLSIPMLPLFDDLNIQGSGARIYANTYVVPGLRQDQIATPQLVYTGIIPQVTHPLLCLVGNFGPFAVVGTVTVQVYLNGVNEITFASSDDIEAGVNVGIKGPFDISGHLYQQGVTVEVYASSTQLADAADPMICAIQQLLLRGN